MACAVFAVQGTAWGASATLTPNAGTGRAGEVAIVKASGLPPNSTLAVLIGGSPTSPETVTTDKSGKVDGSYLLIRNPLPEGNHEIVFKGGGESKVANAWRVRRVVMLDPPVGDGRPGATWRTNHAIAKGGWTGMVFCIEGTGCPPDSFVPADSIKVGKSPTVHDPIRAGADGVMPSTTVIVTGELKPGRYDVSFRDSRGPVTLASVYQVAPWTATEALRQKGASFTLETARAAVRKVVAAGGDLLPPADIKELNDAISGAQDEIKRGNFETAEDTGRSVIEQAAVLMDQARDLRKDKLRGLAEVISSGFDTIQPEGAPAARQGAETVEKGRRKLADANLLIDQGKFDEAQKALKAANDLLKKARNEAGVKATEEPIRW